MTRVSRSIGIAAMMAMVLVVALMSGCVQPIPGAAPPAAPKIAPPAIKQPGVLRVGVDLSYPPFAGVEDGRQAGLDLDTASALAGRLGLKAEFVDVKASQIATALANGDIDVAMSAPFSADVLSRATIAGTYVTDGPALFTTKPASSGEASQGVSGLTGVQIGAQQGSEAYWRLVDELGEGSVVAFPTLREAFTALSQGQVQYVGADALVGAYIARDLAGVRYVGAISPAHLLGIAVLADNSKLSDAVRKSLDSLAADGALDTIRATWVGALPHLPLSAGDASAPSADTTSGP